MPTFERLRRFDRDFAVQPDAEKDASRSAVRKFVADLERAHGCRKGLRVKGIRGAPGLLETTWACAVTGGDSGSRGGKKSTPVSGIAPGP